MAKPAELFNDKINTTCKTSWSGLS